MRWGRLACEILQLQVLALLLQLLYTLMQHVFGFTDEGLGVGVLGLGIYSSLKLEGLLCGRSLAKKFIMSFSSSGGSTHPFFLLRRLDQQHHHKNNHFRYLRNSIILRPGNHHSRPCKGYPEPWTRRIMGPSKNGYKYLPWGYKYVIHYNPSYYVQ